MTSSTKCLRPIYLLYLSCFGLFVLQMGLLIHSRLHPEKTISSTELKKLGEIPFPAIFRICLKPAYNETFLQQAGYETAWSLFTGKKKIARKIKTEKRKKTQIKWYFFTGCNKFSNSTLGWAGHTEEGKVFSNVSGWIQELRDKSCSKLIFFRRFGAISIRSPYLAGEYRSLGISDRGEIWSQCHQFCSFQQVVLLLW